MKFIDGEFGKDGEKLVSELVSINTSLKIQLSSSNNENNDIILKNSLYSIP